MTYLDFHWYIKTTLEDDVLGTFIVKVIRGGNQPNSTWHFRTRKPRKTIQAIRSELQTKHGVDASRIHKVKE